METAAHLLRAKDELRLPIEWQTRAKCRDHLHVDGELMILAGLLLTVKQDGYGVG
jgi:hypothetical protein